MNIEKIYALMKKKHPRRASCPENAMIFLGNKESTRWDAWDGTEKHAIQINDAICDRLDDYRRAFGLPVYPWPVV